MGQAPRHGKARVAPRLAVAHKPVAATGDPMNRLSITTAWNEALAFVRREGHLIFPIAFLLGALPGAAVQLLGPGQPQPGEVPQPGAWMLLMPVAILLGLIANVAISYLALRPGISIGDALRRGLRRFLAMLGAVLIVGLIGGVVILIVSTLAVMLVPGASEGIASGRPPSQETLASLGLVFLLLVPPVLFFIARLSLMGPVAAAEDVGPIAILGRSWRLTSGHWWRLLGFILLATIAFGVVALAVQFVLGSAVMLVAGRPEQGSLSFVALVLVEAALNAVFYMFVAATFARIYAQLTGEGVAEVFR